MNLAFLAKRALQYLVCVTCALTLFSSSIRAETGDLYRQGLAAYNQGDYRSALRYFSAYRQQSESTTYSDPDFLNKLHEAILYCEREVRPKSPTEIESQGRMDPPPPPALPAEPALRETTTAQWTVRLFNIDDWGYVLLNGEQVLQCGFQQTCEVGLSSKLRRGVNTVRIQFKNGRLGWTYGYEVTKDGSRWKFDRCGTAGSRGCKNNNLTIGVVLDKAFEIDF